MLVALLHQYAPSWLLHLPTLVSVTEREALQRRASGTTRERMLRELAEAVEALTTERPLVLVLEDLHWSDGATLDWLAYVARRREAARLLVLGTYRPVEAVVHAHPVRTCHAGTPGARPVCGVGAGVFLRGSGRRLSGADGLPAPHCQRGLPRFCTSALTAIPCFWSPWWTPWCGRGCCAPG